MWHYLSIEARLGRRALTRACLTCLCLTARAYWAANVTATPVAAASGFLKTVLNAVVAPGASELRGGSITCEATSALWSSRRATRSRGISRALDAVFVI